MKKLQIISVCLFFACQSPNYARQADLLLLGAIVYDGSGGEPVQQDVAISGDKISFVGDAAAGISAKDTLHLKGFMLTPGFIDMHSHAMLHEQYGRDARHYLYQGITTALLGCDGFSPLKLSDDFARYVEQGIGINTLSYIGHNSVRREVMGLANRAPSHDEIQKMKDMEMLKIRGGAEKILFVDQREELNGKTLEQIANEWQLSVPETVRRILRVDNAAVMNLELYDIENTRFLAKQDWMMTCSDGRMPRPGVTQVHPRVYGAFTRKLHRFVIEDGIISMPFAIRSMTGLAADFLRLPNRGYIREGMYADIAVFDREKIFDPAKISDPHHFSEGTMHVLVNGRFAFRHGELTGALAGVPILRGGEVFQK